MLETKERRKKTRNVHEHHVGWDSVVGIAIDYCLDGLAFET
jgi:hypothetical protein